MEATTQPMTSRVVPVTLAIDLHYPQRQPRHANVHRHSTVPDKAAAALRPPNVHLPNGEALVVRVNPPTAVADEEAVVPGLVPLGIRRRPLLLSLPATTVASATVAGNSGDEEDHGGLEGQDEEDQRPAGERGAAALYHRPPPPALLFGTACTRVGELLRRAGVHQRSQAGVGGGAVHRGQAGGLIATRLATVASNRLISVYYLWRKSI